MRFDWRHRGYLRRHCLVLLAITGISGCAANPAGNQAQTSSTNSTWLHCKALELYQTVTRTGSPSHNQTHWDRIYLWDEAAKDLLEYQPEKKALIQLDGRIYDFGGGVDSVRVRSEENAIFIEIDTAYDDPEGPGERKRVIMIDRHTLDYRITMTGKANWWTSSGGGVGKCEIMKTPPEGEKQL